MRSYNLLGFMLLAGAVNSTQVSSLDLTKSHTIILPSKLIAIYDLPNTFIQRLDARAPDLVKSTIGNEKPTPAAFSVISALTETITVPITTSTLVNHHILPPQVTPIAPSACFESICKQSVALGYPYPVSTVVAVWNVDHPDIQTLVNQSLTRSGRLTLTFTTPVATVMASSAAASSTSYSFLGGATLQSSTTIPWGPAATDPVSGTHGPPPVITSTNSFSTISSVSTTAVVPETWSNNITSIVPTVTSVHITTVDPSTDLPIGTASSTATFGSETSTAATTNSSSIAQSNNGKKEYGSLLKNKMTLWMLFAVVNIGCAAM